MEKFRHQPYENRDFVAATDQLGLKWKSDWTLADIVSIIQRPFNWAVQQRLIVANPFRGVRHRCGEPRRPMTDAEFLALLRATVTLRPGQIKAFPSSQTSYSGSPVPPSSDVPPVYRGRPGEMADLTWDDVDLDQGVIVLRQHKTSRTQRTPRPRVIQLVPSMVKLLKKIQSQQRPGTTHVFLTAQGTQWNRSNLGLRMRRLRERAGLPDDVKLYGIRHHFGTQSIINGVDIKTLAELMGHTTSRMTEHYVHLAGCQKHLAAAMLQAVCGASRLLKILHGRTARSHHRLLPPLIAKNHNRGRKGSGGIAPWNFTLPRMNRISP